MELRERETLWQHLQQTKKPIVLYGMGNGADEILDRCELLGIPVAGVFASDDFARHQTFRGFTVCRYDEIVKKYPDCLVLIAFASERPEILERFFRIAAERETYAPHLPLFGDLSVVSPSWLLDHETQLQDTWELLADQQSRRVMEDILDYKLSGKLDYLEAVSQRREDLETLFMFSDKETYLDLGAYRGDTVEEFLSLTEGRYDHIYAVEPDPKNFQKLQRFVEENQISKCSLIHSGIWKEEGRLSFAEKGGRMSFLDAQAETDIPVTTIDRILDGHPVSYIKMDVEGAEMEALAGGAEAIKNYRPKLLIAGYHHDDDLWKIPLCLKRLCPEYRIYLRRHPYVPCWEINFFAFL
jgi:FkbM family methyltransferase